MYDFEDDILFGDDEVVIKHLYHYDAYLQLKSVRKDDVMSKNMIKNEGGIWSLQRIEDENGDRNLVKIKNKKTNKYLRIYGNNGDKINAGGSGGRFTLFEITIISAQNHNLRGARLESVAFPGKYIVIRSDGNIGITESCDGDIDCVLIFMTTKRELELINFKNELKITELQQKIDELKSELKLLRNPTKRGFEYRPEVWVNVVHGNDDILSNNNRFSSFSTQREILEPTWDPTMEPTQREPTWDPTMEPPQSEPTIEHTQDYLYNDDRPIPTYDIANRHRAADNYEHRRDETNGKEEEEEDDDDDDDWFDDEDYVREEL